MKYSPDLLDHIESILKPVENTLSTMLAHKNTKPESKTKIMQNIHVLEIFRQTLNRLHTSDIKRVMPT